MALVLNTPISLEERTIVYLATAKQLLATSPFTVAQAKLDLEASQTTTFAQSSFDSLLKAVYALDYNFASMTSAEQDMFNKILEHISPAPFEQNCSDNNPEDAGVTLSLTQDLNNTLRYAMNVVFEAPYKCSIVTADVAQTAGTLTPTAIPTLALIGAKDGKNNYVGIWLTFAEAATGNYTYELTFKDIDGTQVGTVISKTISI